MYLWNKVPLIRAFLPFIAGILTLILDFNGQFCNLLIVLFMVIAALWLKSKRNSLLRIRIFSAAFYLLFFSSGYYLALIHKQNTMPFHFARNLHSNSLIMAKLLENPVEKNKSFSTQIKVIALKNDKRICRKYGKAVIYFEKGINSSRLKAGDVIILLNRFKEVSPALNPGQFDFKKYLANRQIYQQVYVKEKEWYYTGQKSINPVYAFLLKIRESINNSFKTTFTDRDQSSMLSSLIIGYRADISPELMQSFVNTGTIHVLSVSGLHVGVVYYIFQLFLLPFKGMKHSKLINMLLLLILLWGYTVMTGLVPCVARAALMLSFFIIGNHIGRLTNVVSSVLTAIIIMLLIDPFVVTQLGFQLSFAAVLGIITIQPLFSIKIKKKNKLGEKIWGLVSVSLAAQIMTFPISVYYFNQFPVYFLIANLIVIPLSTLIIYNGISFLLLKFTGINFLATITAKVLGFNVMVLTKSLLFLKDLPMAVMDGLYLNISSVILIYLLLFIFIHFCIKKKKEWILAFSCVFIILVCSELYFKIIKQRERALIVYSVYPQSLLALIHGQKAVLYGDSILLNKPDKIKNILYSDFCRMGIRANHIQKIFCNQNALIENNSGENKWMIFDQKRILILKRFEGQLSLNDFRRADFIIISENPEIKNDYFKLISKSVILILDSSNKAKFRKKFTYNCRLYALNYYDVSEKGAYIFRF